MREVILWGGTGQARVLHECLLGTDNRIVAVFDTRKFVRLFPTFRSMSVKTGFAPG